MQKWSEAKMSLRRCSESDAGRPVARLACLALAVLLLAGCASAPPAASTGGAAGAAAVSAEAIPPKVQTLYEQAVAAMAGGDPVEAELQFRAFLLQNPGYPGAHVNLAILMTARGDDAAAAQHLQDALSLDPAHPAALNQLGMLERRQGRFTEAEAAYMKAVTASPDYALAHYNLGVLNELYLQRLDTALVHFERYLEVSGDDEQVTKWVADLKRRMGTYERTASVTE
jgi:tetratricopeptide (TPR) repeat protein